MKNEARLKNLLFLLRRMQLEKTCEERQQLFQRGCKGDK